MELNIRHTFQLFKLRYSIVSCYPIYEACSSLVRGFNLSKSFNYTPYLLFKKVEKTTLSRDHFLIGYGLRVVQDRSSQYFFFFKVTGLCRHKA